LIPPLSIPNWFLVYILVYIDVQKTESYRLNYNIIIEKKITNKKIFYIFLKFVIKLIIGGSNV